MELSPPASPPPLRAQPNWTPQKPSERTWLERGHPQPAGGEDSEGPSAGSRRWAWDCPEKPSQPAGEWPRRGQENSRRRSGKRSSDANPERSGSALGRGLQPRGGLYRAQSLKENLDVISSLGGEGAPGLCRWVKPGPRRADFLDGTGGEAALRGGAAARRCLSPRGFEINVEYDSEEDDLSVPSTAAASQRSSDGRIEGSPTDGEEEEEEEEEGWSSGSGPPVEPLLELKRCSSWEDEGAEWSGSPVGAPGWRRRRRRIGTSEEEEEEEERSRSLERSPALRRAMPERCGRRGAAAAARAPPLPPTWAATGDGLPESPGSATWRAPTRRGRRLQRKRREATEAAGPDAGAWRSSSPETMDEEDSARLFVALFDFDPASMSPNPDAAEEELPFQEGQVLKVYGQKDLDGFYRGMCGDRVGYIPCNMVSEVQVDNDRVRQRLLQEGCLAADPLEDHLDNGAFSTLAQRSTLHPPKPRRSKKAGQKRQQEEAPNFGLGDIRDPSSEEETPRTMVAIFDYNPAESSPNADIEAELNFCAGDLVTILGSMDNDGFYYAEINGRKGLVPSNFVEALVSDEGQPGDPSLGKQRTRKRHTQ